MTTDAINKQRFFETTVGAHYTKPDEALAERALLVRPNCKSEILRGPPPDRTRTLANAGLHIAGHTHYSKLEPLTYQRIALADPRMCADVKASAASGVSAFGRNTEFSKPISECNLGLSKDEEVDMMYSSLKSTLPHRTLPGSQPSGAAFAGIPSLAAVKETLHDYVANTYGPFGYVILRQRLFDISDEEGFAKKAEVLALIRSELCLSPDVMSDQILNAYLQQLVTMKKHELHVGSLMTSLRPALPPSTKKTVLEAFQRLCPQDGAIPLGAWLGRLSDESLQRTLVGAFGGMGGIDDVAGVPVTEAIFIELLSDLAPLTDVDALLFRI